MCAINKQSFYMFTKHTWIDNLSTLNHITNDDTGMYDVTNIDELEQGRSGTISVRKKEKLCTIVRQLDGSKRLNTLWPVKYSLKVGASLLLLMC